MTPEELKSVLVTANAIDPRVQVNVPTMELWFKILGKYTRAEAMAGMQMHYERITGDGTRPAVDAPAIRKIINAENERTIAKQAALEPPRREVKHSDYLRRTQSPEFIALFEQGRREGNAEREQATLRRVS